MPAAASVRSSCDRVNPPTPSAPIWRNARRESRWAGAVLGPDGAVIAGIVFSSNIGRREGRGRGRWQSFETEAILTPIARPGVTKNAFGVLLFRTTTGYCCFRDGQQSRHRVILRVIA